MLSLKDVRSGYGLSEVTHGVTLEAREKEITLLIGPNGAGKSTLLKTIVNLIRPRSGAIHFRGEDITQFPTRDIISKGIAYVSQGGGIFPNMTVRENLVMGGYILKDRATTNKRINEAFELFPVLKERKKQKAGFLSGGERQTLAIARALISAPNLLLLDEPSLGLDVGKLQMILKKLQELNKTGLTILLVEQNLQAASIADRAFLMNQGLIKYEGGPEILSSAKSTSALFFGETPVSN